jgi:hypothetical protein
MNKFLENLIKKLLPPLKIHNNQRTKGYRLKEKTSSGRMHGSSLIYPKGRILVVHGLTDIPKSVNHECTCQNGSNERTINCLQVKMAKCY